MYIKAKGMSELQESLSDSFLYMMFSAAFWDEERTKERKGCEAEDQTLDKTSLLPDSEDCGECTAMSSIQLYWSKIWAQSSWPAMRARKSGEWREWSSWLTSAEF